MEFIIFSGIIGFVLYLLLRNPPPPKQYDGDPDRSRRKAKGVMTSDDAWEDAGPK